MASARSQVRLRGRQVPAQARVRPEVVEHRRDGEAAGRRRLAERERGPAGRFGFVHVFAREGQARERAVHARLAQASRRLRAVDLERRLVRSEGALPLRAVRRGDPADEEDLRQRGVAGRARALLGLRQRRIRLFPAPLLGAQPAGAPEKPRRGPALALRPQPPCEVAPCLQPAARLQAARQTARALVLLKRPPGERGPGDEPPVVVGQAHRQRLSVTRSRQRDLAPRRLLVLDVVRVERRRQGAFGGLGVGGR